MISLKIIFSGLFLMIIMIVIAKFQKDNNIEFNDTTSAICGLLFVLSVVAMIIGTFGAIWGI